MLNILLEHPDIATADLSALDLVFYGAGVMPYELLLRCMQVLRCRFATGYGMTETCGAVTHLGPQDHVGPLAAERMKSCGRPKRRGNPRGRRGRQGRGHRNDGRGHLP